MKIEKYIVIQMSKNLKNNDDKKNSKIFIKFIIYNILPKMLYVMI